MKKNKNRTLIILGSSRNDGDTMRLAKRFQEKTDWDLINLNDYKFSYFDYQYENQSDDFLGLMRHIIDSYDTLIFATPVYWYAMSGIMKVFFDRLTDLITIEKELGQNLKGKNMAVFTSSNGNHLGSAFWLPFTETASYLGLNYLTGTHFVVDEIDAFEIDEFINRIGA